MRILSRQMLASGFCMIILLLGLLSYANGSTLYSNYNSTFNSSGGETFMGSNSGHSYDALGESFSLSNPANMTELEIALGVISGSGNVNISLFDGQPTSPSATPLATSTINYPSPSAVGFQPINLTANLNANQNYWIVVDPGKSSIWGLWGETDNKSNTGVSTYSNNAWTPNSSYVQGAFAVYGTPVQPQNTPEPGILSTLLGIGTAGGGIFLRKFRKA